MSHSVEVSAVVLAGGHSTRMGRDKAFLRINGVRLIDRQIALLRMIGVSEFTVAARKGVNYRVGQVRVRLDRTQGLGPVGGLLTALEECRTPFLFALAVDLPAMDPFVLRTLLQQVRPARGVVPASVQGWEPLAAVYPREILPLWDSLVRQGERRMQRLVAAGEAAGLVCTWRIPRLMEDRFVNWNRPEDFAPCSS